jgi:hypothetical protein
MEVTKQAQAWSQEEPYRVVHMTMYTLLHRISQVINEPGASGGPSGGSNNSKDSGRGSQSPNTIFLLNGIGLRQAGTHHKYLQDKVEPNSNTIHIAEYLNSQSDKVENKVEFMVMHQELQ